jgi:uncharacterized RDD family membrane protein YckC
MEIYDWLLLVLAACGLWLGLSALRTGLRGLGRGEYGGGVLFVLLGLGFSLAGLYTAYIATLGRSPDA